MVLLLVLLLMLLLQYMLFVAGQETELDAPCANKSPARQGGAADARELPIGRPPPLVRTGTCGYPHKD